MKVLGPPLDPFRTVSEGAFSETAAAKQGSEQESALPRTPLAEWKTLGSSLCAFWTILSGITRIAMAIMLRREIEHEWSIALSGVLSVILGIVLILLPGAGLLAYAWLIGVLALAVGIALIYYAFRVRVQQMSGSSRAT